MKLTHGPEPVFFNISNHLYQTQMSKSFFEIWAEKQEWNSDRTDFIKDLQCQDEQRISQNNQSSNKTKKNNYVSMISRYSDNEKIKCFEFTEDGLTNSYGSIFHLNK